MSYKDTVSVAIIGAGVGGICLGLDLQSRGLNDYTIFEAEDAIGGTWYQNIYPGCRCDIPALWYSHSRFLNPDWTETHPERDELLKYWQDVATTSGVDRHVRLRHRFISAEWDSVAGEYTIVCRNEVTGDEVVTRAKVLVSAIGGFHTPLIPKLKNRDIYTGKVVHTARWPKELKVEDLRGKKVAVIGNGCSGVQVLGALAADPQIELYAVSRSAHWYLPSRNGSRNSAPYSEGQRALYRNFPFINRLARNLLYLRQEAVWPLFKLENGFVRGLVQRYIERWMRKQLPKELKDVAIPDFPLGAKRLVFEDGYFKTLNKENVTPVWGSLSGFSKTGIVVDGGRNIDVDYVVLSTGFDLESTLDVEGDTVKTKDFNTTADIRPYHGMSIPGMPNYFVMLGVFSATGHASITFILETQAAYIAQLIQGIKKFRLNAVVAKRSAAEKWYSATSARAKRTVWSQARSYMRANGGTGDVFTHYPGFVGEIWWTNREPEWADYEGADPAARRQVLRRTVQRVVLATALVATLRYGVPASWYDQAHTAALDAAQAVGAPTSIVSAAASALSSAAGLVDSARDYVAGLLKW